MAQAFHILKKDIRHLRLEIGLFLALTLVYALAEFYQRNQLPVWGLLTIAAVYLIARVVLAEAIPGHSQFWISRPYQWKSLLGAKLLFILLFVNVPVFVARLAILLLGEFPVESILPGLLWSHFLILFVFSLPIAAIAALTSGLVPFIFSVLVLVGAGLGIQALLDPLSLTNLRTLVNPIQWVWDVMAFIALASAAVAVVWIQYQSRSTRFSRTLAIAVAGITAVAYLWLPWPVAFAVQQRVNGRTLDSSAIRVARNESSRRLIVVQSGEPAVRLGIPIAITGVPNGIGVEANSLAVSFRGAQGLIWKSDLYHPQGTMKANESTGGAEFNGYILMPRASFDEARLQSATLSASIYLTLFGNTQAKTVSLTDGPVNAIDGLQCAVGVRRPPITDMYCWSLFGSPAKRVIAKFDESDIRPLTRAVSYSPFPGELSLENVVLRWTSRPETSREVTIVTSEPVKSIRLDFEVPDVQFLDYVEPPR